MTTERIVLADGRELLVRLFGRQDRPALFCAHGLTRTGADFIPLGEALENDYWVVCPDIAGRGQSSPLPDPRNYNVDQYVSDLRQVFHHLELESFNWLGTSMGGMIALRLLDQGFAGIQRLILNDIGPAIEPAGLMRIFGYVGKDFRFTSFEQAKAHHREIFAPFGDLSEAEWDGLARSAIVQQNGEFCYAYDQSILKAVSKWPVGDDLWKAWDKVACPSLVFRGQNSDIISSTTVAAMLKRNPLAAAIEVANVGHAPTFSNPPQIELVRQFLEGGSKP
jgi:pimeloyl-ACP methyl ester carboxylesterase